MMRLAGCVLAVAVACTGCSGSAGRTAGGRTNAGVAPERVGDVWLCPALNSVEGFRGLAYPSYFPSPPPETDRLDRCFASIGQASNGGFRLAPPPLGGMVIGGVYLVSPGREVSELCDRARPVSSLAIPCPTLIPGGADDVYCAAVFPCAGRGWFVLEGTFAAAPGYIGESRGSGHLFIIGYDRRSGIWPADTLEFGRIAGRTRVGDHPAVFLRFPDGSELNSGHVALVWHDGDTTYAVSLHGHTALNRRLDLLIALHLRMLTPR